jgi:hypothetical protein
MKGEKITKLVQAYVKKLNPDIKVTPGPSAPAYKGVTTGPWRLGSPALRAVGATGSSTAAGCHTGL